MYQTVAVNATLYKSIRYVMRFMKKKKKRSVKALGRSGNYAEILI